MSKRIRNIKISENILMLLPTNLVLLFLIIIPTILVIWFSLVGYQPTFGVPFWHAPFVALNNYARILKDAEFIISTWRTIYISLISVSIELVLGLMIGSILAGQIYGKKILFPLLIVPLMISPIVVANNFWLIFSANGPVNQIISFITGSDFRVSWFSNPDLAMIPIVVSEIWHWYPLTFLIIFSGLISISPSEIRAASILGASEWQIFWHIKLPKLKTIIIIAVVIRMMEAMKVFDTVHLLTQGGPGTETQTISYYMFKIGFRYSQISYISAGAWIILAISLLGFGLALKSVLVKKVK